MRPIFLAAASPRVHFKYSILTVLIFVAINELIPMKLSSIKVCNILIKLCINETQRLSLKTLTLILGKLDRK